MPGIRSKLVPITVAGVAALVPVNNIPQKSWHVCHGTFNGQEVNSAKFAHIGDNTVIEADGAYLSMSRADFALMAHRGAVDAGYNVTAPKPA